MPRTRILISDSQKIVRLGLRSLLEGAKNFTVIAEAEDADTTLNLIGEQSPDIVILDCRAPKLDAIKLDKEIRSAYPKTKILIYTNDESEESFFHAFHGGADGYLLKSTDPKCVIDALNALRSGELFFGPRISEIMLKRFLSRPRKSAFDPSNMPEKLTKREVEVLRLIALGLTNREIAEKLFISSHTVHAHRSNLLKKLKAQGTAQLVRFAIDHGLVTAKSESSAT